MMHRILSNNTLSVLIFAALVVCISILLLNWSYQSTLDRVEWREEIYQVLSGDSLWSISHAYCPENIDRREWIEEVQVLNKLSSSNIQAGQELIVLVPVKEG